MAVFFSSLFGSGSIGVYSRCTEKMVIIPSLLPLKKAERISEWLKVKLVHTSIAGSVLIGAFVCANSKGVILPHLTQEKELETIKSLFSGNITVIEAKKTAFGNLVLANDY